MLFLGCPAQHVAAVPTLRPAEGEPVGTEAVPTGGVRDGTWFDVDYPLSIVVPIGWQALAGERGANPRLTLVDPETHARLEVSVRPGSERGPSPRRGCDWHFIDWGNYRTLPGFRPTQAATCTPDDPLHARVLGYFVVHKDNAYDFLAVVPPGALLAGKSATDRALGGVRLRDPLPVSAVGPHPQ